MYDRIKKLSEYFNQEHENPSLYIKPELLKNFDIFKKWLIDNGAIFSKNIDFPYVYGPFNIIGCKCVSDINECESILLIPKKLMIISKELNYLDELIEDIEDEFYENEDMSTLYLTLNLYLERKNPKSFFKPYLDLIFSNHNFLNDFTEENMKYFDEDEKLIQSIEDKIDELNELYDTVHKGKHFCEMTKEEFLFCYSQVLSRQFYIDHNSAALIPLADLLNHQNISVHYEIYDSENFIFKYSTNYSVDTDIIVDILPTFIKEYPIVNNNKINLIKPFNLRKMGYNKKEEKEAKEEKVVNEENETESKNKKPVEIKESDYFSISTSKGEKMKKGNQAFNNYFDGGNKYLLKNYGFCLIFNEYDYTPIFFTIETGTDIWLHKYLEILFGKKYKINFDNFEKYLKIKIFFNKVCFYLIKYYRFLYFYKEKKDMKKYINYEFDVELEISFIFLSLECLKLKLNLLNNNKNNVENDLNELENELFNNKENKPNSFKVNAYIYRVTQKLNILNQIELLECILSVMNRHKDEIKSYIKLLDYEDEFVNISQYDTEQNSKVKIINFIKKSKNIVG